MPTILIDNIELEIDAAERLNVIEAAARAGVEIPHYCWHPSLSIVGSCRMCLVEVGTRDAESGDVSMMPKLVPACNTPVTDGTVVVTTSEKVAQARAMVEEDLLLSHPIDCPICDKAGECQLQDYHQLYGRDERRADVRPFSSRRRDLGDVTHFVDRCVTCTRCVRFTREISGTNELAVFGRGAHEEISVMDGFPLDNRMSGNVVDLCPVGALGDKDFLYKQRVWHLRRHASVCTGCSTGCSIFVEENHDRIHRIKPRENREINQWWICNDGRYDYPHVHDERRLLGIQRRDGETTSDANPVRLADELTARLKDAGRIAAVLSPFLTIEEAYLAAKFFRSMDAEALLALGPVPTIGEDESFSGGFTIAAERCPNRRGVERVLSHFTDTLMTFEQFLSELERGSFQAAWVAGGYKKDWIDESTAARFERLKLLIVHDLFPSPLSERATYRLGSASFAERDGSYVSRADHLQSVRWAIRPPAGVLPEGPLFWNLTGGEGLYNSRSVLSELAAEIGYFEVASGEIPDVGVNLKVNLIA